MGEKIFYLDSKNFDKKISKGNWIIDFWAGWCGPCKMIAVEFEKASEEVKGVSFGKVNVDEENDIAGKYDVMSLPTLLLFKDGELVEQSVGLIDRKEIVRLIKKVF